MAKLDRKLRTKLFFDTMKSRLADKLEIMVDKLYFLKEVQTCTRNFQNKIITKSTKASSSNHKYETFSSVVFGRKTTPPSLKIRLKIISAPTISPSDLQSQLINLLTFLNKNPSNAIDATMRTKKNLSNLNAHAVKSIVSIVDIVSIWGE